MVARPLMWLGLAIAVGGSACSDHRPTDYGGSGQPNCVTLRAPPPYSVGGTTRGEDMQVHSYPMTRCN